MSKVIRAEHLAKAYQIGGIGTGTITRDIERFWSKLRGKADPFLKVDEVNDQSTKSGNNRVWSLKDINFEVEQGEALGIIGRNGAGKSTLLKILSRITAPTAGTVKIKGRVASLLEVGTGFHPELSGRENIFLNGAILGMRKGEISRRFDEIVDFAGIARYIDTPVKRYSSGMYVRLAFGVAAHLESEILIVDEVLAVGDAAFQKKCLGKMSEVSKGEGRTVLFVSHNMAAVKMFCQKGMVLEKGRSVFVGDISRAIGVYLQADTQRMNRGTWQTEFDRPDFTLHEISLNPRGETSDFALDEYQEIELNTVITLKTDAARLHLTYVLSNENGEPIFSFSHINQGLRMVNGRNRLKCHFPKAFLNSGTYYLSFYLIRDAMHTVFSENDILSFDVQQGGRAIGEWTGREPGFIKPVFQWEIN